MLKHALIAVLLICSPAACLFAQDLRVMSFNIRTGTGLDGMNSWPFRRDLFFKTIERFNPDILGMQEVLPFQGEEIKQRLKDYDFVGVPRNDGKSKGEMAAVMFRRDRFDKVRDGTFWLS